MVLYECGTDYKLEDDEQVSMAEVALERQCTKQERWCCFTQ